ncbi:MAG: hypothetical protein WB771_00980 [Solirubrobacterales bacterium]
MPRRVLSDVLRLCQAIWSPLRSAGFRSVRYGWYLGARDPPTHLVWVSWRDYVYGEKVYIVLSLTAKSALAWQVYAGALAG